MHLCFFLRNALLWKWNYVCITTKIFAWKCLGVLLGTFISGGAMNLWDKSESWIGERVRGRAAQRGVREKVWSISNASRLSRKNGDRLERHCQCGTSCLVVSWKVHFLRHWKNYLPATVLSNLHIFQGPIWVSRPFPVSPVTLDWKWIVAETYTREFFCWKPLWSNRTIHCLTTAQQSFTSNRQLSLCCGEG